MKSPTYRTILHPNFKGPGHRDYAGPPTKRDYVLVRRISLIGRFHLPDMIAPEQLAALAVFVNKLEDEQRARRYPSKEKVNA